MCRPHVRNSGRHHRPGEPSKAAGCSSNELWLWSEITKGEFEFVSAEFLVTVYVPADNVILPAMNSKGTVSPAFAGHDEICIVSRHPWGPRLTVASSLNIVLLPSRKYRARSFATNENLDGTDFIPDYWGWSVIGFRGKYNNPISQVPIFGNSRRATGPMQSASKNRCCPQTGGRFAPISPLRSQTLPYGSILSDLYQKCDETPELRVTYLRLANHTQVEL